jgi:hypothetical protein
MNTTHRRAALARCSRLCRAAARLGPELARHWRLRRAVGRYEHHLRLLARDTIPCIRADRLDLMALLAAQISLLEHRDREAASWGTAADLLRRIAATERFDVLTAAAFIRAGDPDGYIPPACTDRYRSYWEILARAAFTNDRHERARILGALAAAAIKDALDAGAEPLGVLVLDDIAVTELAIAGAEREPDTAWRSLGTNEPGDQRRDLAVPGHWATVGPGSRGGFSWTAFYFDGLVHREIAGGFAGDEDGAKQAVAGWETAALAALAAGEPGEMAVDGIDLHRRLAGLASQGRADGRS